MAVGHYPHVRVNNDADETDEKPKATGKNEFVDEQDDSCVYHGDEQTNGQHYSQDDPWQHQVVISLEDGKGLTIFSSTGYRRNIYLQNTNDHQETDQDGHAQVDGENDLNDTRWKPIEDDGLEVDPDQEHENYRDDGKDYSNDTGDQRSCP